MRINIIAAVAENRAIGYGNKLIYWLPDDLKRFKQLTTGHTIIMGRKTFESLPKGALPNRRNVVLSKSAFENPSGNPDMASMFPGCDVYPSLDAALKNCGVNEDVYIIGGSSVYEQALSFADRLCLTEVFDTPENADAFFPDYAGWKEVWSENHEIDEKHKQRFRFVDYER
jgi:Dihydrofolate reductase